MAIGELIGGAVGILLLVIVAYVLVGATLSTAEIVSSAQQDLTQSQITRLHTEISVSDVKINYTNPDWMVHFNITNTGSETVKSLDNMDVFILTTNTTPETSPDRYYFGDGSYPTWNVTGHSPDYIHPGQLDPGETFSAFAIVPHPEEERPGWIEVVTGNGAYSSAYI